MIRTNVFLTPRQLDRLRLRARLTGLKMAEMIRRAIDEYLDSAERQEEESTWPKP